jgi:outer membrane biosynthesis protein TonB
MPSFVFKRFSKYALLFSALGLAACGEGWEMVRTTDVAPYGNSRTAGSAIMYVQAKMMPEKKLNLEPAVEAPPEPEEEPAQVVEEPKAEPPAPEPEAAPEPEPEEEISEVSEEMDKLFQGAQRK